MQQICIRIPRSTVCHSWFSSLLYDLVAKLCVMSIVLPAKRSKLIKIWNEFGWMCRIERFTVRYTICGPLFLCAHNVFKIEAKPLRIWVQDVVLLLSPTLLSSLYVEVNQKSMGSPILGCWAPIGAAVPKATGSSVELFLFLTAILLAETESVLVGLPNLAQRVGDAVSSAAVSPIPSWSHSSLPLPSPAFPSTLHTPQNCMYSCFALCK